MDKCQPVPCPDFQDVEMSVTEVCDCQTHTTPGNPHCPIHGIQVQAWISGYQAALDVLKATHQDMFRGLEHYGVAK